MRNHHQRNRNDKPYEIRVDERLAPMHKLGIRNVARRPPEPEARAGENSRPKPSPQRGEERENLQKKRDVIARIKAVAEEGGDDVQSKVQQLVEEYNAIGHVPFKEKDKLYEEYHEVLDKLYKDLNISVQRRRLSKFKDNLKQVAERGEGALDSERARLVRQLDQMKQDVQTYENNLGFLSASSKKGNSLIDEMNRKMQKLKDDMQLVKDKIKAIDQENAAKE